MTLPSDNEWYIFPSNFEVDENQPLDDYTPRDISSEIPFDDTPIEVKLSLTQDEYTKIISSIVNGAFQVFPDEWLNIVAKFWQGLTIVSCDDIADCIETSETVETALGDKLIEMGYGSPSQNGAGTPSSPSAYNSNPTLLNGASIEDCDNDNLFGGIVGLIEFINTEITDFFEVLEVESNFFERSAIITEGIPISDSIGLDTVANTFDQVLEELAEGYAAAYDTEYEQEIECGVFCLVKDTCELDLQTVADYFINRVGASIVENAFEDSIEWFLIGGFAGTEICDAAFALVFQVLSYGGKWSGINIGAILGGALGALGNPNDDWLVLCDDCVDDEAIPIIGIDPCSGSLGDAAGENIQHDTGNFWTVEATARASDWCVSIVRDGGGTFHVDNVTAVSGIVNFFGWKLVSGACSAGFSLPAPSSNFELVMFTNASPFTVRFEMTPT